MEHTERGRYLTEQVAMWAENDFDAYVHSKRFVGDVDGLKSFLIHMLQNAPQGSAAWYMAQELAPNDYDRIDWKEVAFQLSDAD